MLVKYESDSKNITGTFATSKILLTEKLTNGALVTPTPGVTVQKRPIRVKIGEFLSRVNSKFER